MLSHLKICERETTGIRGSLRGPRGPKIGKTVVIALALVVKGMHVSADLFILEARLLLLLIATMMVVQHQPTLATRSRTQSGFSGKPMQCPPLPVSLSVQTVPSSKCVLSPLRWPNWPMPSASRSVEPLVAKSDLAFPCRSSDCEQITDDFEY